MPYTVFKIWERKKKNGVGETESPLFHVGGFGNWENWVKEPSWVMWLLVYNHRKNVGFIIKKERKKIINDFFIIITTHFIWFLYISKILNSSFYKIVIIYILAVILKSMLK